MAGGGGSVTSSPRLVTLSGNMSHNETPSGFGVPHSRHTALDVRREVDDPFCAPPKTNYTTFSVLYPQWQIPFSFHIGEL